MATSYTSSMNLFGVAIYSSYECILFITINFSSCVQLSITNLLALSLPLPLPLSLSLSLSLSLLHHTPTLYLTLILSHLLFS